MLDPRGIREKAGLDQYAMAEALGCSQGHVSRIENGKTELRGVLLKSYQNFERSLPERSSDAAEQAKALPEVAGDGH